jgi:hypothetical protein
MVRPALLLLAASLMGSVPAYAEQLFDEQGFDVRWDNTFRYSVGVRLQPPSAIILDYPNSGDGDRAFAPGLMTNRLDLLSVLDLSKDDFGAQISVAAWYDTVYNTRNDDKSPATTNAASVPAGKFVNATSAIDGRYAEFADSFVYANFALDGMPVSFRLGRQTLLWGESLFFSNNGIAAAQAPVDYVKSTSTPQTYSKNTFLPVNQISLTLQPSHDISLAAYYQLEWRGDRLPGVGSYFSTTDVQGPGAERAFAQPGIILPHIADRSPPGDGQYGVSIHAAVDEVDLGFYVLRFDSKYPVLKILPDQAGAPAAFQSVYPAGVDLYGASFSSYLGESNIAGEFSIRRNMPLVSVSPLSLYTPSAVRAVGYPGYAEGNTLHGQISGLTTLPPSPFWDSADLSGEIAANDLLNVTAGRAALQSGRGNFAASVRGVFQPHYFEVLPNLDISPLVSLGLNFAGNSSTDYTQNSGTGDFEIGVSATYLSVWKIDLTLSSFFGSPVRQPLADRDFLLLGLERTF